MNKYVKCLVFVSALYFLGQLLPGDMLKYDMYSRKVSDINSIIYFKDNEYENKEIEDINKYLFHRKVIDEAHPNLDIQPMSPLGQSNHN